MINTINKLLRAGLSLFLLSNALLPAAAYAQEQNYQLTIHIQGEGEVFLQNDEQRIPVQDGFSESYSAGQKLRLEVAPSSNKIIVDSSGAPLSGFDAGSPDQGELVLNQNTDVFIVISEDRSPVEEEMDSDEAQLEEEEEDPLPEPEVLDELPEQAEETEELDFESQYAAYISALNGGLNTASAGRYSAKSVSIVRWDLVTHYTSLFGPDTNYIIGDYCTLSNGQTVWCASNWDAAPGVGTVLPPVQEWDNANGRKILYYGHQGIDDRITAKYGNSAIAITTNLVSKANTGKMYYELKSDKASVVRKLNEIYAELTSLPDPKQYGFRAYMYPNINEPGTRFDGVVTDQLQALVYGEMAYGSLQLRKSSSSSLTEGNSNYSLQGAEYTLYSDAACTRKEGVLTIGADNLSNKIGNLLAKQYWLKETKAPKGYALDQTVHSVWIESSQDVTLKEVSDVPLTGKLALKKVSAMPDVTGSSDAYSLANAKYGVYADSALTKLAGTLLTDQNGLSNTLSGLAFGTYYVKELAAPAGYELDETVHTVALTGESLVTIQVSDVPETGSLALVKSCADPDITRGNPNYSLAGAVYTVYYDQNLGREAGKLTVKSDGTSSTLTNLPFGTYYIQESQAPAGYQLDKKVYTARINSTAVVTVLTSDVPIISNGFLQLRKQTSASEDGNLGDASLGGAQFTVRYYAEDFREDLSGKNAERSWILETDKNGCIDLKNAADHLLSGDAFYTDAQGSIIWPLGILSIEETKAPAGYLKDESIYIGRIQTDGNQQASIVFEESASGLYLYNAPEKEVVLQEEIAQGEFVIHKYIADETETLLAVPEENAVFAAVLKSVYEAQNGDMEKALAYSRKHLTEREYAHLTTDENGQAASGKLVFGEYVIRQMASGSEDILIYEDPVYFTVGIENNASFVFGQSAQGAFIQPQSDGKVHYTINNRPFKSYVSIVKKDKETGETVTLHSASYKIIKLDDQGQPHSNYASKSMKTDENGYVSLKNGIKWYDTFRTNSENRLSIPAHFLTSALGTVFEEPSGNPPGAVTIPVMLPYGEYLLEEQEVPEGYLLENQAFSIRASQVSGMDEDGQPLLTVAAYDPKPSGEITIKKTFEGNYSWKENEVTFSLRSGKDILNPASGSVLYKEGEVIGIYSVPEDGILKISNLPLSTKEAVYVLQEETTSEAYQLDPAAYSVVLTKEDNRKEVYSASLEIENKTIKIQTTALNAETQEKQFNAAEEITLTDIVTYEGLLPGREYLLKGELYSVQTGEALLNEKNEPITAEQTFIPETPNGTAEVVFVFNASHLQGKMVVFEELINVETGNLIAEHKDLEDKNQQFEIIQPQLQTTAVFENGSDDLQKTDQTITLIDTVAYENLTTGYTYLLKGILMDQTTGEPALDAAGETIEASAEFTPETAGGMQEVIFNFQLETVGEYVVFETLYEVHTEENGENRREIETARHQDLQDEGQTVRFIDLQTTASSDEGSHIQIAKDTVVLTDLVKYTGLEPGQTYVLHGVLMDKSTQKPLLVDGNEVFSSAAFVPEESDGEEKLTFTFEGLSLPTTEIVVFENLYKEGKKVGIHADLDDENQTIAFLSLSLQILKTDAEDGSALSGPFAFALYEDEALQHLVQKAFASETETSAVFSKLQAGEYYLKEVQAPYGYELAKDLVKVSVDTDGQLLYMEQPLDMDGNGQYTAEFSNKKLALHTSASTRNGRKEDLSSTSFRIVDKVSYTGLNTEDTYVMKGTLMRPLQQEPLLIDGEPVTSEIRFTPGEEDGFAEIVFDFDSSLLPTQKIVVFEELYILDRKSNEEILIAEHKDLESQEQTVTLAAHQLLIHKIDSQTGKNITGLEFAFTAYTDKACTLPLFTAVVNQENGTALFGNIPEGTVFIKETKAPEGYLLSEKVIEVEVGKNDEGEYLFKVNGLEVETDEQYLYEIKFENSRPAVPPVSTATRTMIHFVKTVFLTSIIAAAYLHLKRRNRWI